MKTQILGMFAKWPEPGRVKTRLAAQIGSSKAVAIAQAMLQDSLHRFTTQNTTLCLCYSPPNQRHLFQNFLLEPWLLEEQGPGNLGDKLQKFFQNHQPNRIVAIGSDSPSMPPVFLTQAFEQLTSHEVVVGPARDGGFYLLGLKHYPSTLLDGIEWSTAQVCQQLLANAQRLGLSCHQLPVWFDIDTREDLEELHRQKDLVHTLKTLQCHFNQGA